MGVGYQASALHRIVILVVEENAPYTLERPKNSPLPPMPNVRYMRDPARFRSPDATDIIAWRDRLAIKYRSQFEELLSWDETSAYSQDIEIGVGADVLLRYVAARIVEAGPSALRDLVGVVKPERSEIHRALENAILWGFRGRFPQLLLGPMYWLPFQRDMIVEEPDWRGAFNRYGSSFRLADELRDITTFIAGADPRATQWTVEKMEEPDKTLWAAWQAGDAIARVCAAANAHHLPLWTTG